MIVELLIEERRAKRAIEEAEEKANKIIRDAQERAGKIRKEAASKDKIDRTIEAEKKVAARGI